MTGCDHIFNSKPSGFDRLSAYKELLEVSPPVLCKLCGYAMPVEKAWAYMEASKLEKEQARKLRAEK